MFVFFSVSRCGTQLQKSSITAVEIVRCVFHIVACFFHGFTRRIRFFVTGNTERRGTYKTQPNEKSFHRFCIPVLRLTEEEEQFMYQRRLRCKPMKRRMMGPFAMAVSPITSLYSVYAIVPFLHFSAYFPSDQRDKKERG